MKSNWPLAWTAVGVIVSGEAGYLWWSGRLPGALLHAMEASAQTLPNDAKPGLPELPVHVLTPPTNGAVMPQLQNASAQALALRVTVKRPGTDQRRAWVIPLAPHQTVSIAGRDGWRFAFGDELELALDGYRTRQVRLQ